MLVKCDPSRTLILDSATGMGMQIGTDTLGEQGDSFRKVQESTLSIWPSNATFKCLHKTNENMKPQRLVSKCSWQLYIHNCQKRQKLTHYCSRTSEQTYCYSHTTE